MNKQRLLFGISLVSIISFSIAVSLASNKNKDLKTSAYSTSSLPTTIDLNDCSASVIRNYYSSLSNLSTSERQGTNLLKNLKTILKNGQKYYSYDSGNAIWQIYEIADRDWTKSPASSTTYGSYNSTTNKITNYQYGTSTSSGKNNPYIHALYINRNVTNQVRAWDDHQQTQWGINREHVWPKAEGFETSGAGGARGDPFHLMAGNGYANNIHSNYYYGFVNTSSSYTNCGSKYSNLSGNLMGKSKTLGGSTNVFEPQDSDKGDIARAIFYMVARYNYLSGSDSDGIDSDNPNLTLTQSLSDWASSGYSSTTTTKGKMGILTDLLAWHHADPVDEYEIHRNNLLYKNYTNNRNPFIDFPEWADFIWGTASYNGNTYKSYSSTPTGYATPSSDTINGYNSSGGQTVSVTGVSLNKNTASIEVGKTEELEATVAPANATNQGLTWTSSNTSVATVSAYGVVTGVNEGSSTITVTTDDGGFTATCAVTVTPKSSGGGESATASTMISEIAEANNWTMSAGTDVVTYTEFDLDENINISTTGSPNCGSYWSGGQWRLYQAKGGNIIITAASGYELDSVTFTYSVSSNGQLLAPNSSVVTSGSPVAISGSSATFTVGATSGTSGQVRLTAISVTYHSTSGPAAPTLTGITLDTSEVKTTFQAGEEFTYEDLEVTAHYSDGSSESVVPDSVSSPNMTSTGTKTVTVTYEGETATYEITVIQATPTSISAYIEKTYYVGETISSSDIVVTTNLGTQVTNFTFANDGYKFTYADAASGGALTEKTFASAVSYSGLTCSVTAQVQRKAHINVATVSDTLTRELIGVLDTSYTNWSNITDSSNAVYAGNSCGKNTYGGANIESIQIRSNNSNSGIISTTSGGKLASVSITFHEDTVNNRTVDIYGKNTAYTSPTELYSNNTQGTLLGSIVKGTSTSITIEGDYTYIGIRSNSGAIYIETITITYGGADSAVNVANYIMYEDTNNQCSTKTNVAIGYFNNLSSAERSTFMTSNDYVIATARERFNAWLANQGKTIVQSNNDYVVNSNHKIVLNNISSDNISTTFIIVLVSTITLITVGGFILIHRKKEK